MQFLFVLPNLAGGGAEKAVLKTGLALAKRGALVNVVLLEDRIDYPVDPAITIRTLGSRISHGWLGKRLLALRLRRLVATLAPDIVISTLPFADEVAALAALPNHWCRIANTLSVEVSRLAVSDPVKAKRRAARYRALYANRPLIAVSQGVSDDLRNKLGITSRIETIANPFDFDGILKAAAQTCPDRPGGSYVIHVGRFSAQKRHDLLLDAWAKVKTDYQLILLTQSDPRLTAMIAERGLSERVMVAGFQKNPYPWMVGAALLVLCSDHEGLPNVLIESLICGTPVISTDCPSGPREILGKGLSDALVPCNDPAALAAAISAFLARPPDLSQVDLARFEIETAALAYERIAQGVN